MEASNSSFKASESLTRREGSLEGEEEDHEMLKRRILSHPLYGMLVEAHLDCLKIGGVNDLDRALSQKKNDLDRGHIMSKEQTDQLESSPTMLSKTELDNFMEAYCYALSKLKEAIGEPQQESMAFIDCMYSQLMELTRLHHAPPDSPTISSGEEMTEPEGERDQELNATLQLN